MARRKNATPDKKPKFQPQTYTDEQMISALTLTKGLVYLAAEKIGCDPSTIYRRAKESEVVASALKRERGKMVDIAEARLWQLIQEGNATAILFFLKTQAKDRGYIERTEIVQIPAEVQKALNEANINEGEFWTYTLNELKQLKAEQSIKGEVLQ